MKREIAILLFDDVEVLDFAGPFEVFSVCNQLNAYNPFSVFTVGTKEGPVRAKNGLSINPDYTINTCPKPDILIVPGGLGTRPLLTQEEVIQWIRRTSRNAEMTLSVCTGSLLLAKADILDGLLATTHHRALDLLVDLAPHTTVLSDKRYVDNGSVVTAAGISSGIDMSLHVVGRLLGHEAAEKTATYMEYNWPAVPPDTASA